MTASCFGIGSVFFEGKLFRALESCFLPVRVQPGGDNGCVTTGSFYPDYRNAVGPGPGGFGPSVYVNEARTAKQFANMNSTITFAPRSEKIGTLICKRTVGNRAKEN